MTALQGTRAPAIDAGRTHAANVSTSLTFDGVLAASEAISCHLPPTPAWRYEGLNEAIGCDTVIKHENMQPTGAFKVRGGLALAATLSADEIAAGLITCSTGNHAQSIAFAARLVGAKATIVMPPCAPAVKVEAVRALGGEVIFEGSTLGEAGMHARQLAVARGMRFVDPGNEPGIIYGHATMYLELLKAFSAITDVVVPVGSGSGAAGACLVRDALAPHVRVHAVQSAGASAAYESWQTGIMMTKPADTRVSGLATTSGCKVPQAIMRGDTDGGPGLSSFTLVSDDEIDAAAVLLARHARTVAEGAGAASLAGLLAGMHPVEVDSEDLNSPESCFANLPDSQLGDRPDATFGIVVTGGNASAHEWRHLAASLA